MSKVDRPKREKAGVHKTRSTAKVKADAPVKTPSGGKKEGIILKIDSNVEIYLVFLEELRAWLTEIGINPNDVNSVASNLESQMYTTKEEVMEDVELSISIFLF
jgi:hypothetical protein